MTFKNLILIVSTCLVAALFPRSSQAQLTWDSDPATAGIQNSAGTWDTNTTNNWQTAGNAQSTFTANSDVIFNSPATASTITVAPGGVTAGSLTFNNAGASSYTFSGGSITGGALIKNGASGLRFDNSNTFSSVTINGGPGSGSTTDAAIRLGNATALGSAPITFGNTTSMAGLLFVTGFGNSTTLSNNMAFSTTGGITTSIVSTGTAGNPTTLPATFQSTTLSGLLTGGSATSIINNNNSVTGGVAKLRLTNALNSVQLQHWNLNRGALEFTSDGALGNAGNDLRLDVTSTNVGTGLHFGANNIALNSGRAITVQSQTIIDTQAFTGSQINGGITLTGNLIKRGTTELRLNGVGTGAGGVNIAQGTLSLGNSSALGSGTVTIAPTATLSTAPLNTSTTMANAINLSTGTGTRTLLMSGATASNVSTYSGVISGGATGSTLFLNNDTQGTAAPQFAITNSGNTFTANVVVNRGGLRIASNEALGNIANTVTIDSNNGADLTFLNAMNYTRNTTLTFGTAFDFDTGANAVTASGTISGTSGITKIGSGTLTLTGANTYAGGTNVNAGVLQLGDGGTTGSLATTNAIGIGAGATFSINQSDTVTQGTDFSAAAISGAGAFTQAGTGTTVLTASNTYTGATTVSGGTLQLGNGGNTGSLAAASAISVGTGATLSVNRSDTVTQGTHFSTAAISGAGSFTQAGTGTTVLTAANTYTGGTNVLAGKLLVNNATGSGTGTGDVSVASGATLGGTGTIAGNVTVAGTLSPGASIESLNTGSVTFLDDSTFEYEFNSLSLNNLAPLDSGDLLNVNGDLTFNNNINLDLIDFALPPQSVLNDLKLTLISYSGNLTGTFNGLADDSIFNFGSTNWRINYNDTSCGTNFGGGDYSHYVTLSAVAVPEPTSLAFGLISAGIGLVVQRRRQKRAARS